MTKIKLNDGTIVNCESIDITGSKFILVTNETKSVEEFAKLFKEKSNTNIITLMTESEKECGCKYGYTIFSGISYDENGTKTIYLEQAIDSDEERMNTIESNVHTLSTDLNDSKTNIDEALTELTMLIGGY